MLHSDSLRRVALGGKGMDDLVHVKGIQIFVHNDHFGDHHPPGGKIIQHLASYTATAALDAHYNKVGHALGSNINLSDWNSMPLQPALHRYRRGKRGGNRAVVRRDAQGAQGNNGIFPMRNGSEDRKSTRLNSS